MNGKEKRSREARKVFPAPLFRALEVQTGADGEPPPIRCTRDLSEVRGIDVHIRIPEQRVIQDVRRIETDFKLLGLRNAHTLDQVCIQREAAGTFNNVATQRSDLAGRRVHQNRLTLSVENRQVRVTGIEGVGRGD